MFMGIVVSIILILLGALAASSVIIAKKPNAAVQLAKIRPYQGYMGVVALVVALLYTFSLIHIGAAFAVAPLLALFSVLSWAVLLILGLFFSYDLIQTHLLSGKPEATAKLAETQTKIAGIQVPLGMAGIAVGVFAILLPLFYHPAAPVIATTVQ